MKQLNRSFFYFSVLFDYTPHTNLQLSGQVQEIIKNSLMRNKLILHKNAMNNVYKSFNQLKNKRH
jgi:hypothetical protein